MGQIKNIKLHIVTDIKLLQYRLGVINIDPSNCSKIFSKIAHLWITSMERMKGYSLALFDPSMKKKKKKRIPLDDLDEDIEDTVRILHDEINNTIVNEKLNFNERHFSNSPENQILRQPCTNSCRKSIEPVDMKSIGSLAMDNAITKDIEQDLLNNRDKDEKDEIISTEDTDYTYEQLLTRIYGTMKSRNNRMNQSQSSQPPVVQVIRQSGNKTTMVNFCVICTRVQRSPKHMMAFLLSELNTSGTLVVSSGRLVIKGKFTHSQLQRLLDRYLSEYVTCRACGCSDTVLVRGKSRLYFVECSSCTSKISVTNIKRTFKAVTSRRPPTPLQVPQVGKLT